MLFTSVFVLFQDVLRTLTFVNRDNEPFSGQRIISVGVLGQNSSQSCTIMVAIRLVNDNPPLVDLSGQQPSINYTRALNYSFVQQNSVPIASRRARIRDRDEDSQLRSLDVELVPGYPNDGIFLSENVGCSIDNTSTCHIRLVP